MARAKSELVTGLKTKIDLVEDTSTVDPVTQGDFAKVAADEAFMHELVGVYLMPTTDVNAPPYVNLNVNGDRAVVYRGKPCTIKRKHLEVLARMKETRWQQAVPEGYVGQIGAESLVGHTAHAYPFQVVKDLNPAGPGWLEHVLAEAE